MVRGRVFLFRHSTLSIPRLCFSTSLPCAAPSMKVHRSSSPLSPFLRIHNSFFFSHSLPPCCSSGFSPFTPKNEKSCREDRPDLCTAVVCLGAWLFSPQVVAIVIAIQMMYFFFFPLLAVHCFTSVLPRSLDYFSNRNNNGSKKEKKNSAVKSKSSHLR
jgi:hypothetical protein